MFDISNVTSHMLLKNPFLGSIATAIDKVVDNNPNIPTLAVGPTPAGDRAYLFVNNEFWDKLELARGECNSTEKFAIREHKMLFKASVLEHELLHILLEHLTADTKDKDRSVCNIAMDLYINQLITRDLMPNKDNLPEEYQDIAAVFIEDFNAKLNSKEQLELHQSWLYYYDRLMAKKEELENKYGKCKVKIKVDTSCSGSGSSSGSGNSDGDSDEDNDNQSESDSPNYENESDEYFHRMLGQYDQDVEFVDGQTGENITNQIMRIAEKAWEEMSVKEKEKTRGLHGGMFESLIETFRARRKPVTNWKNALKIFVQSTIDDSRRSTKMRRSKRFPGAEGSKRKHKCNLVVAIDTSGSVSDHDLAAAFNEIRFIHKAGATIEIIQCDARIYPPYKYEPQKTVHKLQGRGGTEFQPVFDYYKKKNIDGLIYITDGYCPYPNTYKIKTAWLIVPTGRSVAQMRENNYKETVIKMTNH